MYGRLFGQLSSPPESLISSIFLCYHRLVSTKQHPATHKSPPRPFSRLDNQRNNHHAHTDNSTRKMTTTTMHFGPEWMRKAPSRANPSPPLAAPATATASTYSALVAPTTQPPPEKPDPANPFRYSKEELIRIYKEGGGKGGLGLEVERWEGIVREVGSDPIGLKEMSEAERKASISNWFLRVRHAEELISGVYRSLQALSTRRCVEDLLPTFFRSRPEHLERGLNSGIAPVRVLQVR